LIADRIVRIAVTETLNAYRQMPARVEELHELAGRLDEVRQANVDHHIELMRAAKDQGVQIIGFGELFTGPYFALDEDPMWFDLAEDAETGPTVTALCRAARELSLIVVAPIYERERSGRRFNTAVVIDERGTVLGRYRKTHIPKGKNEQGAFHEPFYYDRSDGQNGNGPANVSENAYFPVFQTSLARIGVAICYDRHFEGVMYTLAVEGAEIVFSPAVTFGEKSQRTWRQEFHVDAARHKLFIAGSNRRGHEPPWTQPYYGDSHIVGPSGPLRDLSVHTNLVISDVDLAELVRPDPSGWDLPRDVRFDIYTERA
jgi:N-carbamoylputrescine amidase